MHAAEDGAQSLTRMAWNRSRLRRSAGDLLHLMAQTIVEVRSGKVDPRVANSISYLGAGFLKAVELVDLEARLAALEKQRVGAEE